MRSTRLKRKTRLQAPRDDTIARRYWHMVVVRGGCVMCHQFPPTPSQKSGREADIARIEGHHVLAKRHLRAHGYSDRLWDTRNGLALCKYHHYRHEHWMQRIAFSMVPDDAIEFADELGLLPLLEREYA